ncbi:MAG: DUF502 domain-containing protein [Bacteroidota bacterium]
MIKRPKTLQKMNEQIPFTKKLITFLTTTLLGGVLVLLPITLFILLVQFVLRIATRVIEPIAAIFSNASLAPLIAYLLAFAIVVAFCFVVGLFVRTRSGNAVVRYFNRYYLSKLPFYNTIQETVRQFFGKKGSSFSQVVLVDVFDTLMTGFVTAEHENGIYTVFVPTAPNPTNGFIFHVKKEKLIFTDTKPEDAMRTVIGVGTGSGILFRK